MMTMKSIQKMIRTARRNGYVDFSIARSLKIDQSEIKRLMTGKYPGESVAARLGLPVKCPRCHRRVTEKKPKQPTPKIGRDTNWFEYFSRKIK